MLTDLKQPKTARLIVEPLTKGEVGKIFAAINTNTSLGARNAALISLMLDTGLRVSEVADLEGWDVHLETQYVKVMGKGSKERMVSFGTTCQKALLDYQYQFRMEPTLEAEENFFLSIDGYPMAAEGSSAGGKRHAVLELARVKGEANAREHTVTVPNCRGRATAGLPRAQAGCGRLTDTVGR